MLKCIQIEWETTVCENRIHRFCKCLKPFRHFQVALQLSHTSTYVFFNHNSMNTKSFQAFKYNGYLNDVVLQAVHISCTDDLMGSFILRTLFISTTYNMYNTNVQTTHTRTYVYIYTYLLQCNVFYIYKSLIHLLF